jgi:hypothetical protein
MPENIEESPGRLRILHKPMGLREIVPAFMDMIPATASGSGVELNARPTPCNARGGESVAAARRVLINTFPR